MPSYLGFLFISLAVVARLWALAASHLLDLPAPVDQSLEMLPLFAILGGDIFVVFGFLSRRCERQADIFGCRAVSCAHGDCPGRGPDRAVPPGLQPLGVRPAGGGGAERLPPPRTGPAPVLAALDHRPPRAVHGAAV